MDWNKSQYMFNYWVIKILRYIYKIRVNKGICVVVKDGISSFNVIGGRGLTLESKWFAKLWLS